jgi:hypothetical protein
MPPSLKAKVEENHYQGAAIPEVEKSFPLVSN